MVRGQQMHNLKRRIPQVYIAPDSHIVREIMKLTEKQQLLVRKLYTSCKGTFCWRHEILAIGSGEKKIRLYLRDVVTN